MDLQAVHDKIAIKELLYRYARACDRKDWKLLPTVFTPDAYLDYTSAGCPAGSRDEVCAFLENALSTMPMTQRSRGTANAGSTASADHARERRSLTHGSRHALP